MRTYQELFETPEFAPLLAVSAAHVAALTVSGLALGTLVHDSTGLPLLAALSMFGPKLVQMIGASVLLSAADRLPPRAATVGLALFFAVATTALALPGLPVWGIFVILSVQGTVGSVGGGVRYGLLTEILPTEGYVLGRSVHNMCAGSLQVCGYAVGGVLVNVLTPRETLLTGAALYVVSAAVARIGLTRRRPRAKGRPSVSESRRTNALLWSSKPRRRVYLALWVPNGLVVGCESLFVSYAPRHAGLLFACTAVGMLAGDALTGRFLSARRRDRFGAPPLLLLLAAPYLIFFLHPALPVALAAVTVGAVGFSASLLLQERLLSLTPGELTGHAFGLHSSGMLTMQGVAAAMAGGIAQLTSPATAMTVMAAASVAVTLALTPGLRRPAPVAVPVTSEEGVLRGRPRPADKT
ncbi:MFS transporter [Streptomyces pristinaespiralis]|uniref:Major facilitator superfamily transporter permease n=2 Tax=Streptomyces pristinaespiralis TaxID=38300 RepID=B5HDX2_STRE2|nr:MFS transporter [Streptomyces pristinaespiralis]ALC20672.1 major facilitator superfamily transporter permease [Streptomyces pristinaespiralis]EDY65033.1 major facilitator superfamily transporter permease [Streptomyces pristinaespiralis ATCC 25486]QMU16500.1 MFS transporter [Streptomyces pristinaespiralis]